MLSTRSGMREAKRLRSRRVRAVLASGLVLGVGAAATLAAWNDSEHTTATFTAGQFGIVGATDGTNFSNHLSPGPPAPATLGFAAPVGAMAPGNTVYALFSVKTVDPSVAGQVQLVANNTGITGLGPSLRYSVSVIAGTSCNATTFGAGTLVVPAGSVLTVNATGPQPLTANGGNQVNYCFAVTLPSDADNSAQGLSADAKWIFQAVST